MAERKAFPLRIDAALYEALRAWAAQEMRSVNGQIEYLLREAVVARGRRPREGADRPAGGAPGESPAALDDRSMGP